MLQKSNHYYNIFCYLALIAMGWLGIYLFRKKKVIPTENKNYAELNRGQRKSSKFYVLFLGIAGMIILLALFGVYSYINTNSTQILQNSNQIASSNNNSEQKNDKETNITYEQCEAFDDKEKRENCAIKALDNLGDLSIPDNQTKLLKILNLVKIEFPSGGARIVSEKNLEFLQKAAVYLKKLPDRISIIIEGHTDNIGTDEHNMTLSQARADAVKKFLVSEKVFENRLFAKGFGGSKPIAPNDSAENRAKNSRIVFTLVK